MITVEVKEWLLGDWSPVYEVMVRVDNKAKLRLPAITERDAMLLYDKIAQAIADHTNEEVVRI